MDLESLTQLLQTVASGKMTVADASEKLIHITYEDIDYAHIDHHRTVPRVEAKKDFKPGYDDFPSIIRSYPDI